MSYCNMQRKCETFSFPNFVEKIYLGEGCQDVQDVVVGIVLYKIYFTINRYACEL